MITNAKCQPKTIYSGFEKVSVNVADNKTHEQLAA